jgi:hypothetical protein
MTITLTPDEELALAEIRRAGGYQSDEDAVLGALFFFARHFDVKVSPPVFAHTTLATRAPYAKKRRARKTATP